MNESVSDESQVITLPHVLTIDAVEELKSSFMEKVDAKAPVTLDAGQITRIDMAGLQVILAFKRAMEEQDQSVHLRTSKAFEKSASVVGIADELLSASGSDSANSGTNTDGEE